MAASIFCAVHFKHWIPFKLHPIVLHSNLTNAATLSTELKWTRTRQQKCIRGQGQARLSYVLPKSAQKTTEHIGLATHVGDRKC